ncbi:efflux RND transporter periplasmic adaptor subunit [Chitinophaga sp. HK235]|uniref:efflux RND transporter periplasmic adaptor subunit n=1 Tax=Chitinophaga sp. HK235 TaxID=2952571 RepID=UPI001BA8D04B|nr:efflux RND transporter periplasmic adaptor subunit [Chitinophaga sp. HK235]
MMRVLLSTGLIGSIFLFSCKPRKTPPNPPMPVNVFTVTGQKVWYYDKYPATTQALSQVDMRPQVQGYITGIFFKEGAVVKKGQKLYEIDQRLYQQSLKTAQANLLIAQGNLKQAQQDADRYVYLNKYNAVAKQLYDHALITLENAKGSVKASEQAVKTAGTNLTYATILAPFDGTVGFSLVKIGDMVSVGSTILNTISTNNPMAVDFVINEKQLQHYEDLLKGRLPEPDSLFTILLPNGTLYSRLGKIYTIDRAVDQQTGAIRVRLVFPNPANDLKVGMSCVVRVHDQDEGLQLVIPNKAIVEQMGEYFVYVVKDTVMAPKGKTTATSYDKGPQLRAFQKKVKLGQTVLDKVIIKEGIQEGDRIVVDGVQSLHDGARVTLGNGIPPENSNNNGKKK